jgi:hypothetical protein
LQNGNHDHNEKTSYDGDASSELVCLLLHPVVTCFYFAFKNLNLLYQCVASDAKIVDVTVLVNFFNSMRPRHVQLIRRPVSAHCKLRVPQQKC